MKGKLMNFLVLLELCPQLRRDAKEVYFGGSGDASTLVTFWAETHQNWARFPKSGSGTGQAGNTGRERKGQSPLFFRAAHSARSDPLFLFCVALC